MGYGVVSLRYVRHGVGMARIGKASYSKGMVKYRNETQRNGTAWYRTDSAVKETQRKVP